MAIILFKMFFSFLMQEYFFRILSVFFLKQILSKKKYSCLILSRTEKQILNGMIAIFYTFTPEVIKKNSDDNQEKIFLHNFIQDRKFANFERNDSHFLDFYSISN